MCPCSRGSWRFSSQVDCYRVPIAPRKDLHIMVNVCCAVGSCVLELVLVRGYVVVGTDACWAKVRPIVCDLIVRCHHGGETTAVPFFLFSTGTAERKHFAAARKIIICFVLFARIHVLCSNGCFFSIRFKGGADPACIV